MNHEQMTQVIEELRAAAKNKPTLDFYERYARGANDRRSIYNRMLEEDQKTFRHMMYSKFGKFGKAYVQYLLTDRTDKEDMFVLVNEFVQIEASL